MGICTVKNKMLHVEIGQLLNSNRFFTEIILRKCL